MGKQWKQWQTLFSWAPKSLWMVTEAMKLKDAPRKKSYDKARQCIKKQRYHFANKGPYSQSYGFPVVMYGCESWTIKEGWAPKNWCFWTVVLEKALVSPLDSKEIKPVNPKGDQPWIFIGRTDTEAPILWPPDAKNWLIRKDPDAGKDSRREEKGGDRTRWLDGIIDSMDLSLSKLREIGFPGGSDGKASVCNAGDPGSIPGLGRSPRERNGNPLQYSCLENPMDGVTW